jgi:hypothetical protein
MSADLTTRKRITELIEKAVSDKHFAVPKNVLEEIKKHAKDSNTNVKLIYELLSQQMEVRTKLK